MKVLLPVLCLVLSLVCMGLSLILMPKAWNKLRAIPHLFAKGMVLWCVICGTAASAYAMRIMSRTEKDPAALLGVILAFFGGELLLMCLKTILNEKRKDDNHD